MELTDYLAKEGIQEQTWEEVHKKISNEKGKEIQNNFWSIEEKTIFCDGREPNLRAWYVFQFKHNISYRMQNVEYPNIMQEVPRVVASLPSEGNMLDVGSFDGLKTVYYKLQSPKLNITGIDRAPQAKETAEQRAAKYKLKNIAFQTAEFLDYSPSEPFDVVVATKVFHEHHYHEMERWEASQNECLRKSYELLKPGGKLIFSAFCGKVRGMEKEFAMLMKRYEQMNNLSHVDLKTWTSHISANKTINFLFLAEKKG